MQLDQIIDLSQYPIADADFRNTCRRKYRASGVLVLPGFVRAVAIDAIRAEGEASRNQVFASTKQHTVYLSPTDPAFGDEHPRNRLVTSSKGCLTDDQIGRSTPLRSLYDDALFRDFLCAVLGETALYEYADPLSSINLHFAETGQELGWHFDNSSFAITLMIQPAQEGGQFEYVGSVRDADAGEMGFEAVADILDGRTRVTQLSVDAGALVLFAGRNSFHRVAPNLGKRARILAVLAYNAAPGVALSEAAQTTFYGRVG